MAEGPEAGAWEPRKVLAEPPEHPLDCPGCFLPLFAPVRTCPRGHLLCEFCRSGRHCGKCPACGESVGKQPSCPQADAVVKAVPRPCRNADAGCLVVAVSAGLRDHVLSCPFNQTCRKCWKSVQYGRMDSHFLALHPGYILTAPLPVLLSVDSPERLAFLLPGAAAAGRPLVYAFRVRMPMTGVVYLWAGYGDLVPQCSHRATLSLTGPGGAPGPQFTVPVHLYNEHNSFVESHIPCERCIKLDLDTALDSKFQVTLHEM